MAAWRFLCLSESVNCCFRKTKNIGILKRLSFSNSIPNYNVEHDTKTKPDIFLFYIVSEGLKISTITFIIKTYIFNIYKKKILKN